MADYISSVSNFVSLQNAIDYANSYASQKPGASLEIDITGPITETGALDHIAVSGSTLLIKGSLDGSGNVAALDGGNAYQGFCVSSGNVTIQDLVIRNAVAQGANGAAPGAGVDPTDGISGGAGGGGGGAGLGGGLFVGAGATVALSHVSFSSARAIGGNGGQIDQAGGNGTGGAGGKGGNFAYYPTAGGAGLFGGGGGGEGGHGGSTGSGSSGARGGSGGAGGFGGAVERKATRARGVRTGIYGTTTMQMATSPVQPALSAPAARVPMVETAAVASGRAATSSSRPAAS